MEHSEEFQVGYSDFRCYKKTELVEKIWPKMTTMSVVFLNDGTFKILIDKRKTWIGVTPVLGEEVNSLNGLPYFVYEIKEDTECESEMEKITHGCMMLPHLPSKNGADNDQKKRYAIVRSDWKHWDGEEFIVFTL